MGNEIKVKTDSNTGKTEYRFDLDIYIFQHNGEFVAYCPSLDILDTGTDYLDVMSNFYEMLQLHVETCLDMGTFEEDLKQHGWEVSQRRVIPPTFSQQMKSPQLSELMNSRASFERITTPMHIAATV